MIIISRNRAFFPSHLDFTIIFLDNAFFLKYSKHILRWRDIMLISARELLCLLCSWPDPATCQDRYRIIIVVIWITDRCLNSSQDIGRNALCQTWIQFTIGCAIVIVSIYCCWIWSIPHRPVACLGLCGHTTFFRVKHLINNINNTTCIVIGSYLGESAEAKPFIMNHSIIITVVFAKIAGWWIVVRLTRFLTGKNINRQRPLRIAVRIRNRDRIIRPIQTLLRKIGVCVIECLAKTVYGLCQMTLLWRKWRIWIFIRIKPVHLDETAHSRIIHDISRYDAFGVFYWCRRPLTTSKCTLVQVHIGIYRCPADLDKIRPTVLIDIDKHKNIISSPGCNAQ